jgi:tetratricopeptide (TPR) repeat protein
VRSLRRLEWTILLSIVALTAVCLSPTLSARKQFTNWDDPGYVTAQPLVRSLARENLRAIFRPDSQVVGNYHPLTVLSLALDYHRGGLDVRAYALTSLVLHLVTTVLVFAFLHALTDGNFFVAALAALWFGIHPMHVESVAWISGRKELLYTLFFLASCLAYLGYLRTGRVGRLALSFVFFVCACLSKATAVPLPLVLLLLDFVRHRKPSARMLLEKAPFFAVSVMVGVLATRIQAGDGSLRFDEFSPPEHVLLAGYAFVMYWVKLLALHRLSPFYPYPIAADGSHVGGIYWALPVVAVALVVGPPVVAYRWDRPRFRVAVFAVGLFTLALALVLEIVPVGSAIMADRYTYLSSVGAFLLMAACVDELRTWPRVRPAVLTLVAAYSVALAVGAYRRTWVWTNSETLWSDAIAKFPFRIEEAKGGAVHVLERGAAIAYQYRGDHYRDQGDVDRAARDWEVLVKAGIYHGAPYINLANVHAERGERALAEQRVDEAQAELARAVELYMLALVRGADRFEAYLDSAVTYARMGRHEQALEDFQHALAARPSAVELWTDVATEALQLRRYDAAIDAASRAIGADAGNANAFLVRGTAELRVDRPGDAIGDLRRAVELAPGLGLAWYNLSLAYGGAGDPRAALEAARGARRAGHPVADGYLEALARDAGVPGS